MSRTIADPENIFAWLGHLISCYLFSAGVPMLFFDMDDGAYWGWEFIYRWDVVLGLVLSVPTGLFLACHYAYYYDKVAAEMMKQDGVGLGESARMVVSFLLIIPTFTLLFIEPGYGTWLGMMFVFIILLSLTTTIELGRRYSVGYKQSKKA